MWKRIASRYPVWYEPRPLAHFRVHDATVSHQLQRSGAHIADTRKAIEISRAYLPPPHCDILTTRAYRNYARYALQDARRYMTAGEAQAALANLHEAMACSQAPEIQSELVALLTEWKNLK